MRDRFVRREVRSYALEKFDPDALVEGFKRGSYRLPRNIRRFIQRPLSAFSGRPRLIKAVVALATIIGRFHTGEHNFVARGCGIGGEGAGFFLARKGLCGQNGFKDLTEALVREATAFLITIGFIERISPKGDLVEVRRPKNSAGTLGYFRYGQKPKKDALGRIRSPLTFYRLASRTRRLFAKTLKSSMTWNSSAVQEPLWIDSKNNLISAPGLGAEGIHSGCAPFDVAGHDRSDPRFQPWRADPMKDPRDNWRERAEAEAVLRAFEPKPMTLSKAAQAIFQRPVRSV